MCVAGDCGQGTLGVCVEQHGSTHHGHGTDLRLGSIQHGIPSIPLHLHHSHDASRHSHATCTSHPCHLHITPMHLDVTPLPPSRCAHASLTPCRHPSRPAGLHPAHLPHEAGRPPGRPPRFLWQEQDSCALQQRGVCYSSLITHCSLSTLTKHTAYGASCLAHHRRLKRSVDASNVHT